MRKGLGSSYGAIMAAMMLASASGLGSDKCVIPVDTQPRGRCLRCGKPHNGNNAFCSAECCKLYRNGDRCESGEKKE
jgi:hypothetical protein